jgi:hypothetical protein
VIVTQKNPVDILYENDTVIVGFDGNVVVTFEMDRFKQFAEAVADMVEHLEGKL